jgi:hypothetical protein
MKLVNNDCYKKESSNKGLTPEKKEQLKELMGSCPSSISWSLVSMEERHRNRMRKAKIGSYDLRINDILVKYSQVTNEDVHIVTKIDLDTEKDVFYVYTDNSSWYFTLTFDEYVNILID